MPDWKKLVRKRLQGSPRVCRQDVIAELAAHLEETHEHACASGLCETEAIQLALREVGDWHALQAGIARARTEEDFMNHRTKSLWLPALTTFLGASLALMLCQFLGMPPHLLWIHSIGMTFYWPWLASLPIFGAAGAHLSQRAKGAIPARLAAGLFPALIMLIVMLLILPICLAIDGVQFLQVASFGLGLINWVALPAFALAIGTVPFLKPNRSVPSEEQTAALSTTQLPNP